MIMKLNIVKSIAFAMVSMVIALGISSCKNDPYRYEVTKGEPVIKYVITTEAAASDSVISSAYPEAVICIVGDNLRSVKKISFNDIDAGTLNPSFINNHTLIVQIPASLPDKITNKIYFHAENGNTVEFPFTVIAPGPTLASLECEFIAPGQKGVLFGNYFVDKADAPFKLIMPDGQEAKIISVEQTQVIFEVPAGCTQSGALVAETKYGEGKSAFWFNDDRNIVVDFDGSHGGNANGNGWRCGDVHKHKTGDFVNVPAIDGDFLFLAGTLDEYGGWNDNGFEYDIWVDGNMAPLTEMPKFSAMLNNNEIANLCVKFEAYVPSDHPWGIGGLQLIWMGDNYGNAPHSSATYPRGMWRPWFGFDGGLYSTGDKWITVTIPMTEFCYDQKYNPCGNTVDNVDYFKGLTIFVLEGSADAGVACEPWIAIDNIRVVPVK